MDQPIWMWALFLGVVLTLLVIDLGFLNKKDHEIGVKESLLTSAFYISLGLAFGGFVWYQMGQEAAQLYWTGFVIEQTLSLDNIFVISLVFTYFGIPRIYQHRVLFWGILGVIVMRGIMIGLGSVIVREFEWVLYIFAGFLMLTGIKMLFSKEDDAPDISQNMIVKFMRRHINVTDTIENHDFFVKRPDPKTGKMIWWATPLFLALCVVEFVDVIFAVDSVPAIFALTTDPYIIYTSNIFAVLGLRALYFSLAAVLHLFHYLKYALAIVLIFIGSKVFITDLLGLNKFPPSLSLGITIGLIAAGILFSLYKTRTTPPQTTD